MKIGLIDSGINIVSKNIINGFKGSYSSYSDCLNHGTICATIIQRIVSNADIFNVKVFDKKLVTSSSKVIQAIRWCIENDIKLISLSVSVNKVDYYYEFKNVCDEAYQKGMIIVASADNNGEVCLPAYLNNVIGVGIGQMENENCFFYNDDSIQIYANGLIKNGYPIYGPATSYATARMAGIIANILMENLQLDYDELKSILSSRSVAFDTKKIIKKNQYFNFIENTLPIILSSGLTSNTIKSDRILFVGTREEVDLFKNYHNFLKFQINDFSSLLLDTTIDFPSLTLLNQKNILKIPDGFKNSLKKCDAIIIGRMPNSLFQEILEESFKLKKKIVSFLPISEEIELSNIKSHKIKILLRDELSSIINELKSIPSTHIVKNIIPILSIINLREKASIFPIELKLRQEFYKLKYEIGQISPNSLAEIFGFDYSYSCYKHIPIELLPAYGKALIESLNNRLSKPDLIIVGIDSPSIPENLISSDFYDKYTCHNISFLFGIQPDAIVFVVNELTEVEYIIRNINCLNSLISSKIIFILFEGLANEIGKYSKFLNVPNRDKFKLLMDNRMNAIKTELRQKLKIPVLDINDQDQIGDIIEEITSCFEI